MREIRTRGREDERTRGREHEDDQKVAAVDVTVPDSFTPPPGSLGTQPSRLVNYFEPPGGVAT